MCLLQRDQPLPLTLLGTIPLPWKMHRAKERELHDQFKNLRHHGEWFKAESELLEFIKTQATEVHLKVDELLELTAQEAA